ncbi:MAG: response regulator [Fibromonadaceae bacterium]|jgi:CheY-like chemotaxis protein|nr:response regulator [Fibromonadaceae bacterium]
MSVLEKVSTLGDMHTLMKEFRRLEAKLLFDFYAALQDFSSKKFLPQWLQKKSIKKVFITENGNEILKKLNNSKRYSVIFYDLETPDLNGLQFLAELGKNPELKSRCKVILLIPPLKSDAQSKLAHLGASALIAKPFDAEGLRGAFEKIRLNY